MGVWCVRARAWFCVCVWKIAFAAMDAYEDRASGGVSNLKNNFYYMNLLEFLNCYVIHYSHFLFYAVLWCGQRKQNCVPDWYAVLVTSEMKMVTPVIVIQILVSCGVCM